MTTRKAGAQSGYERLAFNYVMVVWGRSYVDVLLTVAIPCLLSPGNLPGLPNLAESRFLLITTPEDRARVETSPTFRELARLINVEVLEPQWISANIPYWLKAAHCHQLAARRAAESASFCVFLAPDFLLSDGSLRHLVDMAAAGNRAVLVPGIRVVTETVLPELFNAYGGNPPQIFAIAPRALVGLCLKHVHAEDQRYDWEHPKFSQCPVVCTWHVPGETGLLIRAFHLHPLLVKIDDRESVELLDKNTIDAEFLGLNCSNWSEIYVETDSDNIALFSLTGRDERRPSDIDNEANVDQLRSLAYSGVVNALHRHYFTKPIKLHSEDLNDKWDAVERHSGRIAYQALTLYVTVNAGFVPDPADVLRYIPGRLMLPELIRRIGRKIVRDVSKALGLGRKRTSRQSQALEKAP